MVSGASSMSTAEGRAAAAGRWSPASLPGLGAREPVKHVAALVRRLDEPLGEEHEDDLVADECPIGDLALHRPSEAPLRCSSSRSSCNGYELARIAGALATIIASDIVMPPETADRRA
jgi:hypothetical protein